ncbi:MAG: C45 family peptidase [Anaerolineae bacterium]|nr:C45 family peptidase [Anaerolineae bacterium]MDW8171834.1 C45 family peptidase [Anaerolineae bacterium]
MKMGSLRVLKLSGTPYEMGFQHGQAYHEAIHHFTEERLRLSCEPHWTGRSLSREAVLELARACLHEHETYCPDLMEELRGMADATGLGLPELLIMNGFTDFVDLVYNAEQAMPSLPIPQDDCTAFLIPPARSADGHGLYGQTWDMHHTATPHVILIDGQPHAGPRFLTFTTAGCVGMIGMNEAGICVGINNLMASDGQIGVMWVFVARKILQQTNLDDALKCITEAKLSGGHNYLLMDREGRGYNVEAMSTRVQIEPLAEQPLVHTNHCLTAHNHEVERERLPASIESSHKRYQRAHELLSQPAVTPDMLMEVTRDPQAICVRPQPPFMVETCGAAIMRPATGDFWAVWGLPDENDYEHFQL